MTDGFDVCNSQFVSESVSQSMNDTSIEYTYSGKSNFCVSTTFIMCVEKFTFIYVHA